jgi:hypothetical protein
MSQRIHNLPPEIDFCANNEVMFKVTKAMRTHFLLPERLKKLLLKSMMQRFKVSKTMRSHFLHPWHRKATWTKSHE